MGVHKNQLMDEPENADQEDPTMGECKPGTVADMYTIMDHEVARLVQEIGSDYYRSVQNFWLQRRDQPADRLSPRMVSWLTKIEDDLDENWRPKWNEEEPDQIEF